MARRKQQGRPEVLALLRECKTKLWDDAARLVLADWLDDNGANEAERALGEVIRSQARRHGGPWNSPYADRDCQPRESDLVRQHGENWLGALASQAKWSLRRGLFQVQCLADTLAAGNLEPPELPEEWEWVESLGFIGCNARNVVGVADSPLLEQVSALDLHGVGLAEAEALLRSPRVARLPGLCLGRNITHGVDWLLRAAPNLAGLRAIDCTRPHMHDGSLAQLLDSPLVQQLCALNLNGFRLEQKTVAALAGPRCSNLHDLSLESSQLRDRAVPALANSPHLANLRRLSLADNIGLRVASVENLVASSLTLTALDLLGTSISKRGIRLLAESPWSASLRWLALPTPIDRGTAQAVVSSPHLAGLTALKMGPGLPASAFTVLGQRFRERLCY
jgi:uncharacterized protein (TIGR02996 family)